MSTPAEIEQRVQTYSGETGPGIEVDNLYVVCPYCGHEHGDPKDWVTEKPGEMHCDECGGRFEFWAEVSTDYWSKPLD